MPANRAGLPNSYTAAWVLPIAGPPIANGTVRAADGRIVDVGHAPDPGAVALGHVAVLPALVNAHTHLELSFLAGRVPPAGNMVDWVRAQLGLRRAGPSPAPETIERAAAAALAAMRASGTGVVGDVANGLSTVPLLQASGCSAHVFHELLGFSAPDPEGLVRTARAAVDGAVSGLASARHRVHVSLAPHAPYSVSPDLFRAIRADVDAHAADVCTVHVAESPEESEFLAQGTGRWRTLLDDLGAWNPRWVVPGVSPVAYLAGLGFLDGRVLAVHGVQCGSDDVSILRRAGCTVVVCPRSNRHVGAGDPPLAAFYDAAVPVAVGTDSLASAPDLNLFQELAAARRLAPSVPARRLLESATVVGARALGFARDHGTIEPGTRADLIAVRVPEGVGDVEEYLVSGIDPADVTWLAW